MDEFCERFGAYIENLLSESVERRGVGALTLEKWKRIWRRDAG